MPNIFRQVESEFKSLKNKFTQGIISDREFKDRLKKLRVDDKKGKCWTIGARTGKWYCYDGKKWVESQPPSLQEGKAICIYCGYENELENDMCDYCGGNLDGGEYSCPKCGCKLNSPTQFCPECKEELNMGPTPKKLDDLNIGAKKEGLKTEAENSTWNKFVNLDSEIKEEEEALADDGGLNFVLRFVSPSSLMFFFGITGLIFGIIGGVFTGISSMFPEVVENLPNFLQSIHGQLPGGIVFGLFGGAAGFVCLGILGLINAVLINVIISFLGGIKIRLEKY
jgi:hypothetical protein